MINDLLDKLEEANRIFGAGIATGIQNHADVELCRKQVDDEIKRHYVGRCKSCGTLITMMMECDCTSIGQSEMQEVQDLLEIWKMFCAEIDELKGLLEE